MAGVLENSVLTQNGLWVLDKICLLFSSLLYFTYNNRLTAVILFLSSGKISSVQPLVSLLIPSALFSLSILPFLLGTYLLTENFFVILYPIKSDIIQIYFSVILMLKSRFFATSFHLISQLTTTSKSLLFH